MIMESVESSNLAKIGYDEDSGILRVEFKSGTTYDYKGVPLSAYETLLESNSKGACFALIIKGHYEYEKTKQ